MSGQDGTHIEFVALKTVAGIVIVQAIVEGPVLVVTLYDDTADAVAGRNPDTMALVFSNTADKFIGQLVNIEPGTPLYGPPIKYDEKFVRSFLRSLTTPIIIDPDDSPEVAALKRAVRETKIELKARYDDGEDIAQIMTDTRKELQELGLYRSELQAEVNKIIRKDAKNLTDEQMQDFVDAANKMLAERGAKPIVLPGLMKHRLKMKLEVGQGEEERTTNQIQ